jgi:hypothetical protein
MLTAAFKSSTLMPNLIGFNKREELELEAADHDLLDLRAVFGATAEGPVGDRREEIRESWG